MERFNPLDLSSWAELYLLLFNPDILWIEKR